MSRTCARACRRFFRGDRGNLGGQGGFRPGARPGSAGGKSSYGKSGYGPGTPERLSASERLSRSALVLGTSDIPALREAMLALTVVNHPGLVVDEFDEVAAIEFDNRDLRRLWTSVLNCGADGRRMAREAVLEALERDGHKDVVAKLDRQIRNARLWIATEEAAFDDAREGFFQALSLHKRTRALKWQKKEIERDLAEATEEDDAEAVPALMRTLGEIHQEIDRLENQEAMIDGFGLLSGRLKGAARA
jgi:DNA primase